MSEFTDAQAEARAARWVSENGFGSDTLTWPERRVFGRTLLTLEARIADGERALALFKEQTARIEGDYVSRLAAVERELEALRPVVEAAERWNDMARVTGVGWGVSRELCEAVATYRGALASLPECDFTETTECRYPGKCLCRAPSSSTPSKDRT